MYEYEVTTWKVRPTHLPTKTYDDLPTMTYDDLPTKTYDDLPTKTYEDLRRPTYEDLRVRAGKWSRDLSYADLRVLSLESTYLIYLDN
ncbi:hypothetical protein CHU98_g10726 [Xylaria longipes]|nr:hypothetical protein CHU98_g10726 [Xylaria longipes]